MKYICIKNTQSDNDGSKYFTVGKWYDIEYNTTRTNPYFAVANSGNVVGFGDNGEIFIKEHFISIVEYRLNKLNELTK